MDEPDGIAFEDEDALDNWLRTQVGDMNETNSERQKYTQIADSIAKHSINEKYDDDYDDDDDDDDLWGNNTRQEIRAQELFSRPLLDANDFEKFIKSGQGDQKYEQQAKRRRYEDENKVHSESQVMNSSQRVRDIELNDADIDLASTVEVHEALLSKACPETKHSRKCLSDHSDQKKWNGVVSSRVPTSGKFITATNLKSGKRMYMLVQNEQEYEQILSERSLELRGAVLATDHTGLNVRNILSEIEAESFAKALAASKKEDEMRKYDSDPDDSSDSLQFKRTMRAKVHATAEAKRLNTIHSTGEKLWVEKYAPRTFIELLSSDDVNRELLSWLKSWDRFVFKKKHAPKLLYDDAVDKLSFMSNAQKSSDRINGKSSKHGNAGITTTHDNDGRPEQRIVLLTGPPGLGKTTVAHVLARQAGYNPLEINASDDRTSAILLEKIKAATEMASVFNSKRPNCLVIDEIDGTLAEDNGKSAIDALVALALAKSKKAVSQPAADIDTGVVSDAYDSASDDNKAVADATAGGISHRKRQRRRTAKDHSYLRRPVICICNDQYVPALRPLRQVAKVFAFERPQKSRLLERLKYICQREKLQAEDRALSHMCDITNNDVRSCINTLQFIRSKCERFTMETLSSMNIAQKDVTKGMFDVWQSIFHRKHTDLRRPSVVVASGFERTRATSTAATASQHLWTSTFSNIQNYGDHGRIVEGIFHNMLRTYTSDTDVTKTVAIEEWMSWAAMLDSMSLSQQDHGLSAYIPTAAIGIHLQCASIKRPRLMMPSASFQCVQQQNYHASLIRGLFAPHSILAESGITNRILILDMLTQILDIIAPPLRNIPLTSMTVGEKSQLHALVDTMIGLALTYKPHPVQYSAGGTVTYQLAPSIDEVSMFTDVTISPAVGDGTTNLNFMGKSQDSFKQQQLYAIRRHARLTVPDQLRHAIAHEIELELARRSEKRLMQQISEFAVSSSFAAQRISCQATELRIDQNPRQQQKTTTSSTAMLRDKNIVTCHAVKRSASMVNNMPSIQQPSANFIQDHSKRLKSKEHGERIRNNVHFKFNEGYSNAVRRPISIEQLLA